MRKIEKKGREKAGEKAGKALNPIPCIFHLILPIMFS
jgi:hypothetical protein